MSSIADCGSEIGAKASDPCDTADLNSVPSWGLAMLVAAAVAMVFICVCGIFGRESLTYVKFRFGVFMGWEEPLPAASAPAAPPSVQDAVLRRVEVKPYHELVTLGLTNPSQRLASDEEKRENKTEGDKCSFCFVRYAELDACAFLHLGCKHYFHHACMEKWVRGGRKRITECIVCFAPLLPDEANETAVSVDIQPPVQQHEPDPPDSERPSSVEVGFTEITAVDVRSSSL
ncbi:hypothetical protein AB1Y20_005788 [Prymnesium parvum]|uniref:RING-type domain-containing protein n=1 Tax=Prymnesium parvum TaxID=97485 RepID=A0AB34J0L1_PRYPA